jgi:hypothetical protein
VTETKIKDDDLFEVLKYGKCSCGKPGTETHNCPFDEDVNNNPNSSCNCCDECTENCADGI